MEEQEDDIPNSVELIDSHIEEYFDESEILVMHEIESEVIHSDVYIIKPSDTRSYHIILSCGMSSLPMNVPEDMEDFQYAEILMLLPKEWNMNYEEFSNENNYWPIRALKQLSKYPHLNDTWFGYGHTIPLDDENPSNHNFSSIILLNSITLPEDFITIERENITVSIYSAIPIYKEELDFVLEEGSAKLLEKFQEFNIEEIININRKNVCI